MEIHKSEYQLELNKLRKRGENALEKTGYQDQAARDLLFDYSPIFRKSDPDRQKNCEKGMPFAYSILKYFVCHDLNQNEDFPQLYRCGRTHRINQYLEAIRTNPLIISSLPGNGKTYLLHETMEMGIKRGIFPLYFSNMSFAYLYQSNIEISEFLRQVVPLLSPCIIIMNEFENIQEWRWSLQYRLADALRYLQHHMQYPSPSLQLRIIATDNGYSNSKIFEFFNQNHFHCPILPILSPGPREREALFRINLSDHGSSIFGDDQDEIMMDLVFRSEGVTRAEIGSISKRILFLSLRTELLQSECVKIKIENNDRILVPCTSDDPDAKSIQDFSASSDASLIFKELTKEHLSSAELFSTKSYDKETEQLMLERCRCYTRVMWPCTTWIMEEDDFVPTMRMQVTAMFDRKMK
eukprot:gb/GECH01010326.1/.p1 GENE.gb/GECH01010326.1/~~gb/GECH01010326.1/.p1  ORF type:complete len:410 (+),score=82.77 gb/GECH01010326.1/:1-1230(+)